MQQCLSQYEYDHNEAVDIENKNQLEYIAGQY